MIIVSQNKNKIVNFDHIVQIYIAFDGDDECGYIMFENENGLFEELGEYETEGRAEEVLQDFIKGYKAYRTAECDGYTNVLEETAVYEMPEE